MPPQRVEQLIAAGLFLLALLIRLIGIDWGLPNDRHSQSYHPDEPVNYAVSRQIEPAKLHFTPGFYNYGTLYFTVLRVAGDMAHAYGSAGDDPVKQAASGLLAGRIVSTLAGAGTTLLVFLMLRRFANRFGASMGALLVAFAPAFVVHSRFATPDVLATFLLSASLFFAMRIAYPRYSSDGDSLPFSRWFARNKKEVEGPEGTLKRARSQLVKDAAWAGAFAGLSAGTKYTGAVALLCLIVALWRRGRPPAGGDVSGAEPDRPSGGERSENPLSAMKRARGGGRGRGRFAGVWKALVLGLSAAVLAFILSTPGALLDSAAFARDVAFELGHSATGHGLVFVGYGSGFVFHFGNLILGVGFLLTILGLIGLTVGAVRKEPWAWIGLAMFVPYYILIGRAEVFFMRYTFPLLIPLALGFGWLMARAHDRKGNSLLLAVLGIIAVCGVDFGGLRGTVKMTYWMMSEDPRDAAARYLKEKAGGSVGLVSDPWFYTPPIYPDAGLPRFVPAPRRDELMAAAGDPRVVYLRPKQPADPIAWDSRLITEVKPDYIVYSSFEYYDVARLQNRSGIPETARVQAEQARAFMDALQKAYEPDKYFGKDGVLVHDLEYIRPNIQIWKRKSTPSTNR